MRQSIAVFASRRATAYDLLGITARSAAEGQRVRILVVDDDEPAGYAVFRLLGSAGHEVKMTTDAIRALQIVIDFRPDAVVIDLGMPFLNGVDLAKEIRALPFGDPMRLIAHTVMPPSAIDDEPAALFDGYVPKPPTLAALLAALGEPVSR